MARSSRGTTPRRSDEIRARRESRSRKVSLPRDGSARRTSGGMARRRAAVRTFNHEGPPVLVRGALPSQPAGTRQKSGRARRRYDVPISSVPGAEVRLPALPQVRLGWRLVSFLLVGLLGFALYQIWNSPDFKVEAPEVHGLKRLSKQEVTAVLDVSGEPVFTLDSNRLEHELLAAFPEISAAEVQVSLPASVVVTVTERMPVLTWQEEGQALLVDAEGMAFPVRANGPEVPQPVVQALSPPPLLLAAPVQDPLQASVAGVNLPGVSLPGGASIGTQAPALAAQPFLTPEMVNAILSLAGRAPQGTTVVYEEMHGFGWQDPRGWVVYFGDDRDVDMKLNVYQALVDRLLAEEIVPALISVEHVHNPYYRLGN